MLNLILASKVEAIPHTQMLKNANGTLFCGSDNPKIASFLAIITLIQDSGCRQEFIGVIKNPANT